MPFLDPLITLAQIAAATSTVRIGTNIYLLALRHPLETARRVMTLDLFSGGRVTLGVGTGWLAEEFEACGIDFATRGLRTAECIQAVRTIWTADEPEFHGRFFSFGPVRFEPKPLQQPHPPIIVAGDSPVALKRAVRLADGWCGLGHTPESATPQAAAVRALLAASGRDRASFETMASFGSTTLTPADVQRYARAGIDHIVVLPWERAEDADEQLEQLAARLELPGVRL
jgi:probable F420-dependent oxidoreductase